MKKKAIVMLAMAVPAFGQLGGVMVCTNCANVLGQGTQIAKDVAILEQAIATYNQIVTAGRLLTNMQWRSAMGDLNGIAAIIQTSQGLAMSAANLDRQFSAAYPGFLPPMSMQPGGYYGMYNKWSTTTMQTLQGAMRGTGLNYQQLMNQAAYAQYLQNASTSAIGQTQAIQAGNQIGVATVQAVNNLNAMMTVDMESRQAVGAYQVQNDMTARQIEQKLFGNPTPVPRTGYALRAVSQ